MALNLYDMLKPIDKGVEIHAIKLIEKKGGKSDVKWNGGEVKAAVIVCSDSVSQSKKEDKSGLAVVELLKQWDIKTDHFKVVPDEIEAIQKEFVETTNNALLTNHFRWWNRFVTKGYYPRSFDAITRSTCSRNGGSHAFLRPRQNTKSHVVEKCCRHKKR